MKKRPKSYGVGGPLVMSGGAEGPREWPQGLSVPGCFEKGPLLLLCLKLCIDPDMFLTFIRLLSNPTRG